MFPTSSVLYAEGVAAERRDVIPSAQCMYSDCIRRTSRYANVIAHRRRCVSQWGRECEKLESYINPDSPSLPMFLKVARVFFGGKIFCSREI